MSASNLKNTYWKMNSTLSQFSGQSNSVLNGIAIYIFDDGTAARAVSRFADGDNNYVIKDEMRSIGFKANREAYYYDSGTSLNKKLIAVQFPPEVYGFETDTNLLAWFNANGNSNLRFQQLAYGKIVSNAQPHFEQLVPVDTDEPTSYVARWDCSKTTADSIRAYLTGSANNYELHFFGYGEITNYTRSSSSPYSNAPWASYMTQIKKVQFHDGITAIGFATFYRPTTAAISNITLSISNTIRIIRQEAFNGVAQSNIIIPNGTRVVCPTAFCAASTSTTLTVPYSVQEIDYSMPTLAGSDGYAWLKANTSAGSYLIVGDGCLIWGKPTGTIWTIPDGVKSVNCAAWDNRANVTKVNLPSTTKIIALYAFLGYSSLQSIILPQGTRQIKGQAFANCTALTKIWIPRSVTNIVTNGGNGGNAEGTYYPFTNCTNLTIYCEIDSSEVPDGWHSIWNNINATTKASVVWNYAEPTNW